MKARPGIWEFGGDQLIGCLPFSKNDYWGIHYILSYFPEYGVSFHVNLCNQGNVWQIHSMAYPG